jgi:hypothetical protein
VESSRGAPGRRAAPLEEAAKGMPLLPLAAYRQGFEQISERRVSSGNRRAPASGVPWTRS